MAANTLPIYTIKGDVAKDNATGMADTMTTAAGDYTGISANYKLVFTAVAVNGGFIERLRFKAIGSNVASVARIFLNNGATPGTGSNNSFYGEASLPATTAVATSATIEVDYPMNFAIPAGFRIYVGLGTTVAAGWVCIAIGGQY